MARSRRRAQSETITTGTALVLTSELLTHRLSGLPAGGSSKESSSESELEEAIKTCEAVTVPATQAAAAKPKEDNSEPLQSGEQIKSVDEPNSDIQAQSSAKNTHSSQSMKKKFHTLNKNVAQAKPHLKEQKF